jgi:hypothetical protein
MLDIHVQQFGDDVRNATRALIGLLAQGGLAKYLPTRAREPFGTVNVMGGRVTGVVDQTAPAWRGNVRVTIEPDDTIVVEARNGHGRWSTVWNSTEPMKFGGR